MSYQMSGILLLVFKNPPKFRRVGGLWRERRKIVLNLIELGGSKQHNNICAVGLNIQAVGIFLLPGI